MCHGSARESICEVIHYPNELTTSLFTCTTPVQKSKSFDPSSFSEGLHLVHSICELHARLSLLKSLRPAPTTNELFTDLVQRCCKEYPENVVAEVLHNPKIQKILPSLRQICSNAEYELELYWVEKLVRTAGQSNGKPQSPAIQSPRPVTNHPLGTIVKAEVQQFPYYDNYSELTLMEVYYSLQNVPSHREPEPLRILFIGSGPLPLSSIMILDGLPHDSRQRHVTNLDRCPKAIDLSQKFYKSLKRDEEDSRRGLKMDFVCADASGSSPIMGDEKWLEKFHVVYIAALVGDSVEDKIKLVSNISSRLKMGTTVIMRSAHSMRKVLYSVSTPRNFLGAIVF